MASTSKHHHELTNGVGKCSVPMWMGGCPAGFCDKPAYGKPPECKMFYNYAAGERQRLDGRYNGYVPGLACPSHGGPEPTHFGDPCVHCDAPHDDVAPGPCPAVVGGSR
jgi:hypothetical protein